ncbi:MAG: glycoside hydrolase family 76 protein [Clostridium sp.]|nr:glycoside hydrolase family 76 protein [Clostridium sp.]
MKKLYRILILGTLLLGSACATTAQISEPQDRALRNISRAIAIMDATWDRGAIVNGDKNIAMADNFDLDGTKRSGSSDVWPYTAAIEAHCSVLEALEALESVDDPEAEALVTENRERLTHRLDLLIDNLEWYRGTYKNPSYAVIPRDVSPYAVPRASRRGGANVTGILNVYDDQMWIARELIRAYRLTGKRSYLENAVYLTDYCLDGWDCWHDENGREYGGITWGPGYNSKHACSNAPIIQPLCWLSEIYACLEADDLLTDDEKAYRFYDRDENNKVFVTKDNTVPRSERYLQFARKVYDWQKNELYNKDKKVFWDMMGADGTIIVDGSYRQHVDCGDPVGNFYPYNTGTMIAGAVEIYRLTGDEALLADMADYITGSVKQFGVESYRNGGSYVLNTDASEADGFLTWFNDVLLRSLVDAVPFSENNGEKPMKYLNYHNDNLDYAFENFNNGGFLPINLKKGWATSTMTKPFHQFAFASEYGYIARLLIERDSQSSASIAAVEADTVSPDSMVYTLAGVCLGRFAEVRETLPDGLYVAGHQKIRISR